MSVFEENEKILCFHGKLIYEAKVAFLTKSLTFAGLEGGACPRKEGGQGPPVFRSLQGWDEWVPESRTLKWNDDNLKKQADLVSLHLQTTKKVEKKPDMEKGKKRVRENTDSVEEFVKRLEIKIPIPDELKAKLVDDWENITKNQRLVSLPREPTVNGILQKYKESLKTRMDFADKNNLFTDDIVDQIVDGLMLYFDKALGNILLYKFERSQYVEVKEKFKGKNMSDIYGAEHLLRLFVQLPSLISHTNMDSDAVNTLKDHFALILEYLVENKKELFLEEYENATSQYISFQSNFKG